MAALTHKIIQSFCATDDTRYKLLKPFSIGVYTYATDGHAAIRIDRRPEYNDNEPMEHILSVGWVENVAENLWTPLGTFDLSPEIIECPDCEGKAKDVECGDCDSDGEITFTSESGIKYDCECQLCDGSGKLPKCERCDGTGKVKKLMVVEIGTKQLNFKLLCKIAALPNPQIATEAVDGLKAIPFRFDGGIGIIMPMRKEGAAL